MVLPIESFVSRDPLHPRMVPAPTNDGDSHCRDGDDDDDGDCCRDDCYDDFDSHGSDHEKNAYRSIWQAAIGAYPEIFETVLSSNYCYG